MQGASRNSNTRLSYSRVERNLLLPRL
jgi:hypothetical protein